MQKTRNLCRKLDNNDYYSECVRVLMFYETNHATINSFLSTLHYTYPDDFFYVKSST